MDEEQAKQYQKAQHLIAEKQWLAAAAILEELINKAPNDEVTKKLVWALYQAQQFARAFVYFVEQPAVFTSERQDAELAVRLLLHNQSYIAARLFINELPLAWQTPLLSLVVDSENQAREKYQTTLQTRLRSFYHLGDCSLAEQQERVSDAQQLPLQEYLTGAQFLLRDPFTHQLIKASLVDTLRQLGVDEQVTVRWLDGQEYQLVPADVLAIDEQPVVRELRARLAAELGNQNPSELQLANQELQMQLMILYPLIEQKITDATGWIQYLIARIRGEQVATNPAIEQLQGQLSKIIDDLSQKD
ncbi:hypothetical protein [Limosilactobacillus sp.]|uniref:hypothetical protein n=1 Tax=Limosilactobacillus sp. TaxID=2773925 RepID=UPI003F101207